MVRLNSEIIEILSCSVFSVALIPVVMRYISKFFVDSRIVGELGEMY